ncbi:Alanine racemase (Alr) (PDB:1BD0) [Commensalibacter communis]|uniref:Alanine racemase n=1 Tax=Commensalibacter communis TaxID=2972786 RepID=A0A9W4TKV2_9PROT|nr:alanine racemase [Commensalibacter communis]CAI3922123.1 Alanine racemase (Alr) (PDB:1BD0) [Commensalibacter communis]CAI3922489.1 Alanine racemase (Alr) (PDB:1BD0) [Commensalibacter communis]CAI3923123.1 Alanine racemase (Alr) (PDB:1BD0) [Commensalibacter communis]CAI3936283.1 Alanine racemase (Alr) (PDB:1BD0) [Commensalibacter communis]CAI3940286.1 Alanine racemase (Alr) (PDB:1BD0) [Commensalibacter communis]
MSQPYPFIDPTLFTQHAGGELYVDLSAIVQNYHSLQKKVAPAQCGAVVKANAYGLGMVPVAKALAKAGCKEFFVAHLDEGIALRNILGKEYLIYVLHGVPYGTESIFLKHYLIPILNDIHQLQRWSSLCKDHQTSYAAGVQFDTGMSRFGIGQDELSNLQQVDWSIFHPILVMSHLACADTPNHIANQHQLEQFHILKQLIPNCRSSLAASSGIFLGNDWHFDIVRPGVALYGGNPTPSQPNPMKNVISLQGKIIQTRHISKGAFIGYGASFTATKDMRLALISIGYADGFFRAFSNKISATSPKFPGTPLALLGRVSMDSLCLDITNLPEVAIQVGDKIEIIGDHCSIDTLAQEADTIGYEILTSLGNRYHRIYT